MCRCKGRLTLSALEELRDERAAVDFEVRGDIGEDPGEGADAETRVVRDRGVMVAALLSGEPEVTAGLASDFVAVAPQGAREIAAKEIAREPRYGAASAAHSSQATPPAPAPQHRAKPENRSLSPCSDGLLLHDR